MWDPASAESHTVLAYAPIWARASTSDGWNTVRVPYVDPLTHEGHDRTGEHEASPEKEKKNGEQIRFTQLPVEQRQVDDIQDHGHGDLDETNLLVTKEEVTGTNTADEEIEKARSRTGLTQHGSVESGLAIARLLTVRLLTVCGLLTITGLAIRLLTITGLTVRLLTIAGLLTVRLLPIAGLTVRLLTVTGLLTIAGLLTVTGLLTIVRLLPVRLLRSRHDVS